MTIVQALKKLCNMFYMCIVQVLCFNTPPH
uniref:Uncharacterized protein n=1 Tax=Moniliophthora roreri TaxID=221103 RepID=A0A0W0EVN1_MONRR